MDLVVGGGTVDNEVRDRSWSLGGIQREIPIIASAMDGVVDVGMCIELTRLGALGVLNLEGVQCRYEDPEPVLEKIASVGREEFVGLMQELYSQPVREDLVRRRIAEIKAGGGIAAVSATPVAALCRDLGVPVVIGNCVTYDVTLQLMRAGAAGVMVGIGPGAACTSRGVL